MALVKTFGANDLKEEFKAWNRDYFSYNACEEIINLFEEQVAEQKTYIIFHFCSQCGGLYDTLPRSPFTEDLTWLMPSAVSPFRDCFSCRELP